MKISKKEQIILLVLILTFGLIAYYKLSFVPQLNKIKALKIEKLKLEDKVQKTKLLKSEISKKTLDIKTLNIKIGYETIKLLPTSIMQEKLIVDLDEIMKKNNIDATGLGFSDINLTEFKFKEAKKQDKNELKAIVDSLNGQSSTAKPKAQNSSNNKIDIKYIPETMKVMLTFKGTYADFIKYIKDMENYPKRVTVDDLNILQDSDQSISGTLALCYYAIPKISDEDKEFLKWDFNNGYGKENPFDGVMTTNLMTTAVDNMQSIVKVIDYDFVMSVRSINSDLPTFMLGKAKDDAKGSYIFADNAGLEPIEIQLTEKDGKYYYKYKSKKDSYPKNYDDYDGNGVEFVPFSNSNINFKIYSAKRIDGNDNSGASLKITNKTGKKVIMNIENDDTVRPRVSIASEGQVDVVRK